MVLSQARIMCLSVKYDTVMLKADVEIPVLDPVSQSRDSGLVDFYGLYRYWDNLANQSVLFFNVA